MTHGCDKFVFQPFRLSARADIADHQNSLGAFERTQHDLDRKFAAILAPARQFRFGADLKCERRGKTIIDQALCNALRNDLLDVLPKQFIATIAEFLLGLKVQQDNLPCMVYHDHRVRSRLQQTMIPRLHQRQVLFRILANADVADHQNSFAAFKRAQHDLDRKLVSLLPERREIDPFEDLPCHRGGPVLDEPLREPLRNNARQLLTQQLNAAVSELHLRLKIKQDDFRALVHHHHRLRSRLQKSP